MSAEILITEEIDGPAVTRLGSMFSVYTDPELGRSPEKLLASVGQCRALVVRNQTRVTKDVIAAAPRLEVIGRAGVGLDNIDISAASAAGIVVTHTPDQNSISVAELALGMMLALARNIPNADRDTRSGGWQRRKFSGIELCGRTLGVVGFGRIGFLTALRARALGMSVVAHDIFIGPDAATLTASQADLVSLEELLQRADFVSCHVPLAFDTRGLFNYERFASMKPGAYFLNLSRGEVVDEAGLVRALREKRLAGAALDVRAKEPPGPSPLADFENVILTPHIAAFTQEGQDRVVTAVCTDVASVLSGEAAKNAVRLAKPTITNTALIRGILP